MGKHPISLRAFLRKEILADRLRTPLDDIPVRKQQEHSPLPHNDDDTLILSASIHGGFKRGDDELDSIFGEAILTGEELREKKIEEFLARTNIAEPLIRNSHNPVLGGLKDELKMLIFSEASTNCREKELIKRQKAALREEIRVLENIECAREVEAKKIQIMTTDVPEPIGQWEKKCLMREGEQISKARATMDTIPGKIEDAAAFSPRRKRKVGSSLAEDYDGEERLRYGQPIKNPAIETTGRWQSDIHDYIPRGEGQAAARIADLVKEEERKISRLELADYARKAAVLDRKLKKMNITEEWIVRTSGGFGSYY